MSDISSSLAPFFQEYDLSQLDLERSAGTIIERTLQFGNREEIHWLFHTYPPQRIQEWVANGGILPFLSRTVPFGPWFWIFQRLYDQHLLGNDFSRNAAGIKQL